ncbi:MAG: hypothetical protein LQ349_000277 [Xanthoria aureola]|nr:MAG: hypothetical protein LQ349_000277 [Xanthoria aureola]
MTPAFGFSAGDFVNAIVLLKKISRALRDSGGASSEYQGAVVELENLQRTLQHLASLEPTEDNINHVNAIRGMALACQIPLRDFLAKLSRYETSLGPWASQSFLHKAARKAQWATAFSDDVKNLRALVAAKQISISLLLAAHTSQTVSRLSAKVSQQHFDLQRKTVTNSAKIDQTTSKINAVHVDTERASVVAHQKLDGLSAKVDQVQTSASSASSVAKQVFDFLVSFSREAQETMRAIVQSNWQIYHALLEVQDRVPQTPTGLLDSNIKFENALGEYWEFPYEVFRHWEPFEAFLQVQFKEKPGEDKVRSGEFHIVEPGNQGTLIKRERWTQSIKRGATLASIDDQPGTLRCKECYLVFSPTSDDPVGSFTRITVLEEDQEVEKRQAAEDLKLYGSRLEPPESIEVDESIQLASLPPKQSASEFTAAVRRPAKVRKKGDNKEYNYGTVTQIDWNCGLSPLDAWLNQSALPSVLPVPQLDSRPMNDRHDEQAIVETEQIPFFRRIHIQSCPEPAVNAMEAYDTSKAARDLYSGDTRTQIYHRNIADRYPALPYYLVTRLAKANCDRAERLKQTRDESKGLAEALGGARYRRRRFEELQDEEHDPRPTINAWDLALLRQRQGPGRKHPKKTQSESECSFWSGKISSPRARSIRSSCNGFAKTGMAVSRQRASYVDKTDLPIRKHVLQDLRPYCCTYESCQQPEAVFTSRGEYLYHELVNHDEDPSTTTTAERAQQSIQYRSKQSVVCPFCKESTGTGKNGRAAHIGRHMEEIAFTACNTPYQEWYFYSDSSLSSFNEDVTRESRLELSGGTSLQCTKTNPANGRACNVTYANRNDLIRHDALTHAAGRKELRCSYCAVDKTFPRKSALTRHMKSSHPSIPWSLRPTQCPVCALDSELFKEQAGLQQHMQSVHPDVPWPCPIPPSARPGRPRRGRVKSTNRDCRILMASMRDGTH